MSNASPCAVAAALMLGCTSQVQPPPATTTGPDMPSRMRGMYSYIADASMFVDCRTANRLPVAQEGDNAALEAAYLRARPMPGAPLLVIVDARLEQRPPMEGNMKRTSLVVDRFIEIAADQGCSGPMTAAAVENTFWRLEILLGKPAEVGVSQRQAHLILQPERKTVVGSGGCNRLSGSYALEGERLSFSRMATTRMACPQGMEQERAFLDALGNVQRWRIVGQRLELFDSTGASVAQFEAVYLR